MEYRINVFDSKMELFFFRNQQLPLTIIFLVTFFYLLFNNEESLDVFLPIIIIYVLVTAIFFPLFQYYCNSVFLLQGEELIITKAKAEIFKVLIKEIRKITVSEYVGKKEHSLFSPYTVVITTSTEELEFWIHSCRLRKSKTIKDEIISLLVESNKNIVVEEY